MDISTPAKRRKVPQGRHPVWADVGGQRSGLKVGYRRSQTHGVWVGKIVEAGLRREAVLGPADDDGAGTEAMSYAQATARVVSWADGVREAARVAQAQAGGQAEDTAVGTVEVIVLSYIAGRQKRDPKNARDAKSRLTKHVLLDEIAAKRTDTLTKADIEGWRARRTGLAPATIARLLNDVRAALGPHMKPEARLALRAPSLSQKARDLALLGDADTRKVVEACAALDEDLGHLVLVLAATGARFSQVAALRVMDVQVPARRVMVPKSAKGRKRSTAPVAVPLGDDVLARLAPALTGRALTAPLLERWISRQITTTTWERVERKPWVNASEMLRGWKKALKAAGVNYVEPYALRHGSIVRGLQAGLPVRLVAALHDTSVAMIESHYSAFIVDQSEDLVRRTLVSMTSAEVTTLRAVK